jgi:hypothetical protein
MIKLPLELPNSIENYFFLKRWSIVYKKGYQRFDTVSSTVTTKVKGLGWINATNTSRSHNNGLGNFRLFDTADYVIPGNEYNSVVK